MSNHYPFVLEPLPYAYDALEPYINADTVRTVSYTHLDVYKRQIQDKIVQIIWFCLRIQHLDLILAEAFQPVGVRTSPFIRAVQSDIDPIQNRQRLRILSHPVRHFLIKFRLKDRACRIDPQGARLLRACLLYTS